MCIHREFSHESVGAKVLKIGTHLPKLLSNIKGYTFLGHSVCTIRKWPRELNVNVQSKIVQLSERMAKKLELINTHIIKLSTNIMFFL